MNRFAFILLFIFLSLKTYGQLKLNGQVIDARKNPIELATVKLETPARIAMTNDSGYFHMHLPANIKKGDVLSIHISKEGYKDVVKNVMFSDSMLLIILEENSPTAAVKPSVHVVNADTGYFQNKNIAVRQTTATDPRVLTKENMKDLFFSLPSDKSKRISIECIKDDLEALHFASSIHELLVLSGYTSVSDVMMVTFPQSVKGQFINSNAQGVKITIGHKP